MAAATVEIVIKAIDQITDTLDKVKQKTKGLREVGDTLQRVGMSLGIVGGAITGTIGFAVKTFTDFEYAMRNVQAVSGAMGEELQQLEEAARRLGESTIFSAKEVAEAQYYLASAGMKTQQIVKALDGVLQLAAATQSDLAFSSNTVASALSQFGLAADEASRVSDVFTAAISNSQATLEKLAYSMRYVGPVASSFGMSIEETTAMLMALYNAGYQGEQAGTILRGVFASLTSLSKDAAAAIERLGLSFDEINPATNNLIDILERLQQAGATTTDLLTIFGREAGPGVAALLSQGTESVRNFVAILQQAGGTAQQVAAKQMDSLYGRLKTLQSAFQEMQLAIGEAVLPIITKFVEKLKGLIDWFNNLPEPIKNTIANMTLWGGAILTAAGGISLMIGTIMKMIATFKEFGAILQITLGNVGMIKTAFTTAFSAISSAASMAFKGILAGLNMLATNPQWLLISAIIAGIVVIIRLLKDHWQEVVEFFKKTLVVIKTLFVSVWEGMKTAFTAVFDYFKKRIEEYLNFWKTVWGFIKSAALAVWEAIKAIGQEVVDFLKSIWQGFVDFWAAIWETIKKVALAVWKIIKAPYEALKWLTDKIQGVFSPVEAEAEQSFEGVSEAARDMYNQLVGHSIIPDTVDGILAEFERLKIIKAMIYEISSGWATFRDTALAVCDAIDSAMTQLAEKLKNTWLDFLASWSAVWKNIEKIAVSSITKIQDEIKKTVAEYAKLPAGTPGTQKTTVSNKITINVKEPAEINTILKEVAKGVL